MRPTIRAAALAQAAALPAAGGAHEVLHAVEPGRATAVRVRFADGSPLADAEYQLSSPAGPAGPHQRGRTDRNGYASFVPDRPGRWLLRVLDGTGHGAEIAIDVPAAGAAAASGGPGAALALRPLVGAAVIGAIFLALHAAQRRRRARARPGA